MFNPYTYVYDKLYSLPRPNNKSKMVYYQWQHFYYQHFQS